MRPVTVWDGRRCPASDCSDVLKTAMKFLRRPRWPRPLCGICKELIEPERRAEIPS
jgi:hypothetical protein